MSSGAGSGARGAPVNEQVRRLQDGFAADGFRMDVEADGDRAIVTVIRERSDDCLIPQATLRGYLARAMDLDPAHIEIRYPPD